MLEDKQKNKLGLLAAIVMVVSSIVGIGIFIKNGDVFAQGNSIAALVAWIVGGLLALMYALTYAGIARKNSDSNAGLGAYAKTYIGKKFSIFVKITLPLVYYAILGPALVTFTYIFLKIAIGQNPGDITYIELIGVFLSYSAINIVISTKFPKVSNGILSLTLIVKAIPLVIGALIGLFTTSNGGGIGNSLGGVEQMDFFPALLIALPLVLFAYDAFLTVGNIAKDVENPKKNVPLAVLIGMVVIIVLYVLITIGQINHNQGTVEELVSTITKSETLGTIISYIIVISAMGTTQAIYLAGVNSTAILFEEGISFSKSDKNNKEKGGVVFTIVSTIFFLTFVLVSALQEYHPPYTYVDLMSNMPTLFFFGIYNLVAIGYLKDLYKNNQQNEVKNLRLFTLMIVVMTLATATIIGYKFYAIFDAFASGGDQIFNNSVVIVFPILMYFITVLWLFIVNKTKYNNSFGKSLKNAFAIVVGD